MLQAKFVRGMLMPFDMNFLELLLLLGSNRRGEGVTTCTPTLRLFPYVGYATKGQALYGHRPLSRQPEQPDRLHEAPTTRHLPPCGLGASCWARSNCRFLCGKEYFSKHRSCTPLRTISALCAVRVVSTPVVTKSRENDKKRIRVSNNA